MNTRHEEVDVIMVQQTLSCAHDARKVTVISDDTDVFVLLLYHYNKARITIPMYMESPINGRSIINIAETVKKHCQILPNLLPAHALTGCDTVACHFGVGKGIVLIHYLATSSSRLEFSFLPAMDSIRRSPC